LDDSIFDELRADYPGFREWFRKASRSQRDALLVDGHSEHAALTILKKEQTGEYGIVGPALKLCTFKVANGYSGQKYGELLLKAVFEQAHVEAFASLYVTVFDKHELLIALLEDFGFEIQPDRLTSLGELVLAKLAGEETTRHFRPSPDTSDSDPRVWPSISPSPSWCR
jgi:GNAT superfamily N-acetyltransferase